MDDYDDDEIAGLGSTRNIQQADDNFLRQVFLPDNIPPVVLEDYSGFIQIENSLSDLDKYSIQASKYTLKLVNGRKLFFMPYGRVTPKVLGTFDNITNLYSAKLGNAFQANAWRRMNTRVSNVITERAQQEKQGGALGGIFKPKTRGF